MSEGEQDEGQGPPLARYAGAWEIRSLYDKMALLSEGKQNAARESEDDAFRQQISMNILKLFYLLPYDGNTDFYTQFAARMELADTI